MLFACQSGNLETVQNAAEAGEISLAETDYEGRSCLHIAAAAGHLHIVRWLLDSKVGVNKKDGGKRENS